MKRFRIAAVAALTTAVLALPAAHAATPNTPPIPVDDVVVTTSGGSIDIPVLANDLDPDHDALRLGWVSVPGAGTIAFNADGSIRYTANADFAGVDSFMYAASDGTDNSPAADVVIKVVDATKPVLSLPAAITAEAAGAAGARVSYTATATDNVDGALTPSCTPAGGGTFALGTTRVACTVSDAAGNTATGSFDVKVQDTTAPTLVVPAQPLATTSSSPAGTAVSYGVTATDAVDAAPRISCTAGSGSLFAPGTTHVSCTATDASGNSTTNSFDVVVTYAAPTNRAPVCSTVSVSTDVLRSPDGSFRLVFLYGATDADGGRLSYRIDGVTQDEATSRDADAFRLLGGALLLRAERDWSGDGRVYTIAYTVTDSHGASCSGTETVSVQRDSWRAAVKSPRSYDSLG